ncbi:uncharacterized protein JCM10292_006979 [Rhodotorula paludigena]|uniref:uncharacterized protein n=1 Tax=Rhodotorula paludigena TaxID=86838 RepID=UPI00317672D6
MGNNPSTPQAPPGSSRASRTTPGHRPVALPSAAGTITTVSTSGSGRRHKPPLELPDVAPSHPSSSAHSARSLASSSAAHQAHPPPRRKPSDRPPVVDDEPDPDPPEGPGGSLRGALQGKAEHVVYGPRRSDTDDDGIAVALHSPPTLVPAAPVGRAAAKAALGRASTSASARPAEAMAIPGVGSEGEVARSPAGGGGAVRDGSLTNAGMGAIGAMPFVDPDDTTHPGFAESTARLTSDKLLSTESMPVLNSPKREDAPADSPFGEQEGDNQQQQQQHQEGDQTPGGVGHITGEMSGLGLSSRADGSGTSVRHVAQPQTSFAGAVSSIIAPSAPDAPAGLPGSAAGPTAHVPSHAQLPPPHTASPTPPSTAPSDTVQAPAVPADALPLSAEAIPSGTSVFASPSHSRGTTPTGAIPSPAVLLPPAVLNAPVAAIPIPLLSVPSQTIAQNLLAAAVDLGAGEQGVPTLIKWKNEDGQEKGRDGKVAKGPKEVFVTGTFAKGWKTKIELRKTDSSDFSALISLPPGPHRLKFIVDNEWKASKHLPVATDADGNLINYLQVNPVNSKIPVAAWQPPPASTSSAPTSTSASRTTLGTTAMPTTTPVPVYASTPSTAASTPSRTAAHNAAAAAAAAHGLGGPGFGPGGVGYNGLIWPLGGADDDEAAGGAGQAQGAGIDDDDSQWTQEIPADFVAWGEWEQERDDIENAFYAAHPNGPSASTPPPDLPPPPSSAGIQPPMLPAQLEKGPLNHAAYVTQGSGDDNSILPKPDHSVINHLAASPIKGGFLSVGVTTRYKRKVYYKALNR